MSREVHLFDSTLEQFSQSKLPSKGDVIRRYLFLINVSKYSREFSISTISKELEQIYSSFDLQPSNLNWIGTKISQLLDDFYSLKKTIVKLRRINETDKQFLKRKSKQDQRETDFLSDSNDLFDVLNVTKSSRSHNLTFYLDNKLNEDQKCKKIRLMNEEDDNDLDELAISQPLSQLSLSQSQQSTKGKQSQDYEPSTDPESESDYKSKIKLNSLTCSTLDRINLSDRKGTKQFDNFQKVFV